MQRKLKNSQALLIALASIAIGAAPSLAQQANDNTDPLEPIRVLIRQHQLSAAESKARSFVSQYPFSASGHFLLGYILFSEKKATESLAEYTSGARFRTPGAEDLMAVGADYVLLNDNADADKWFSKVTEMEPANALAWYYLGRTRFYENQYEDAIKAFQTCLQLNPNDVRAETNMGLAYKELGRDADAIAAFQQAIAWEEKAGGRDAQPYLDLGSFLFGVGKTEQSLPYLLKAVDLEAGNPKTHEELGRAYDKLHREVDAEAELRKAVALAPEASSLHYTLGRILKNEGKDADAAGEFAITSRLNGTRSSKDVPNFDLQP